MFPLDEEHVYNNLLIQDLCYLAEISASWQHCPPPFRLAHTSPSGPADAKGVPIPDSCAQPNRHRPGSFLEIFLR
jgi:hypothetical protein